MWLEIRHIFALPWSLSCLQESSCIWRLQMSPSAFSLLDWAIFTAPSFFLEVLCDKSLQCDKSLLCFDVLCWPFSSLWVSYRGMLELDTAFHLMPNFAAEQYGVVKLFVFCPVVLQTSDSICDAPKLFLNCIGFLLVCHVMECAAAFCCHSFCCSAADGFTF